MQGNLRLTGMDTRFMIIAVSLSTLVCALIGGKAHQTLCSLAWETRETTRGPRAAFLYLIRIIFDKLEVQHCRKSHIAYLKLIRRNGKDE